MCLLLLLGAAATRCCFRYRYLLLLPVAAYSLCCYYVGVPARTSGAGAPADAAAPAAAAAGVWCGTIKASGVCCQWPKSDAHILY